MPRAATSNKESDLNVVEELQRRCDKYRKIGSEVMIKKISGIAHGRTIELHQDSGVADGQEVEVLITVVPAGEKLGSGFLRTEGALADDDQWDAIMDEIHQARRNDPRAIMPELE